MRKPAGVALAVALVLSTCGTDEPAAERAADSVPTTVATSTTATVPPVHLATPSDAARHLHDAWRAGDRRAGLQGASPEAVDAVFARPFVAGTLRGCDAPGQLGSDCIFRTPDGVLRMHTEARPEGGYWVTRVEFAGA